MHERLQIKREHLDISQCRYVYIHLVLEEHGSVVDYRAGAECVDQEPVSLEVSVDLNFSLFYEVNF